MNENEFQDNKIPYKPVVTVSNEQRAFLKKNYESYCYENRCQHKNIAMNHYKSALIILTALSAVIFSACIISDCISGTSDVANNGIVYDSKDDSPQHNTDAELTVAGKPALEGEYVDENGKYTTEGIAIAVRPCVVEIYAYSDKDYSQIYGTGSGVVMSDDGYIITNAHVLEGGESFKAVMYDGSEHKASIVGKDNKTDLAVIKINPNKNLVPAEFGNSDEIMLGEQVMAIGNPGGLTGSITGGYVSGLNRKIKSDSTGFEMNCIQTDAAISPGNSGGALVNMYGQVIGITSSKYVSSSYEGLGFAITINEAKPVIEELIKNGYVSGRYKIGITFYSNQYARAIFENKTGFPYPENINGILIGGIDENCDIAHTEIQAWDFITEVEDTPVTDYDSVMAALEDKNADDTVKAHVLRVTNQNGETEEFDIIFRLMPDTSGYY